MRTLDRQLITVLQRRMAIKQMLTVLSVNICITLMLYRREKGAATIVALKDSGTIVSKVSK